MKHWEDLQNDMMNNIFENEVKYNGRIKPERIEIIFRAIRDLNNRYWDNSYISFTRYDYIKNKNLALLKYRP